MAQFASWCTHCDTPVGAHYMRVLTGDASRLHFGIGATAAIVPDHYASEEHVARVLRMLGKPGAAALIEEKLPTTKAIRSGDLGEIYATEWIAANTVYQVPVKRLRWKDHRNMAMRGEDVIGIALDPATAQLSFLKTEAKSRANLTSRVLTEARAGLDKEGGLPSAHALSFISARLVELGNLPLADAIDNATLNVGIPPATVRHLLFTFSGNAPDGLLTDALRTYAGIYGQWSVGLRVDGHTAFVGAVYDKVIADAHYP
ncbi:Hachiman antiphage defense system protein HamA [Sphingomonas profundi]|uniref:Hachiman antiphage defense system protein HamA n=1 Tax=Alterirhizorhabdus profundi TaxID=2681549 RepID=UPI0012E772AC|nr:Hachiman antiphage defense system protein HamA [Sphingomonas profundi]